MSDTRTARAEQGYNDYLAGKMFNECPFQGFRPEDIDHRWEWQLGWMRAQKEKPRETK